MRLACFMNEPLPTLNGLLVRTRVIRELAEMCSTVRKTRLVLECFILQLHVPQRIIKIPSKARDGMRSSRKYLRRTLCSHKLQYSHIGRSFPTTGFGANSNRLLNRSG